MSSFLELLSTENPKNYAINSVVFLLTLETGEVLYGVCIRSEEPLQVKF